MLAFYHVVSHVIGVRVNWAAEGCGSGELRRVRLSVVYDGIVCRVPALQQGGPA